MESSRELANPLLNEVVTEVLFSHLDNLTLKTARFVHTSWAKEGFSQLRKSSMVKLDNSEKLNKFLNSEVKHRFFRFGFHIQDCDWSQELLDYLKQDEPRFLDIYFPLILDNENVGSFDNFSGILRQHCKQIRFLCLTIDYNEELHQPTIDDSLQNIQYPKLKSLLIRNKKDIDAESLTPLFIAILKYSPKLTEIEADIQDVEFWKNMHQVQNIKNVDTLAIPKISSEIINTCVQMSNLNLKKLTIQFDPSEIPAILSRFAGSLEYLGFFTPKESALSPINFPVMPRLKILNAGQSQLSFPSILSDTLPILEKLTATYWDWVYSFEALPDIHYYWRTCQPHENIKSFDIILPERTEISGHYVAMENFVDFSNRIQVKFPNLTNIRLANVFIKEGLQSCIEAITESFGPQLKELIVKTYSPISDCDSTQLFSSLSTCINLEILDLDPASWSTLWKNKRISRNIKFDEFKTIITPLTKLRILNIPYIEDFSILEDLFGSEYQNFPEMTVLGVVGERCVNRFDIAGLKRCRPNIKIILHNCFCSMEDTN